MQLDYLYWQIHADDSKTMMTTNKSSWQTEYKMPQLNLIPFIIQLDHPLVQPPFVSVLTVFFNTMLLLKVGHWHHTNTNHASYNDAYQEGEGWRGLIVTTATLGGS